MENTIDYQIIIFLINFTTKFEEEPHGIKIIPTKKYFAGIGGKHKLAIIPERGKSKK